MPQRALQCVEFGEGVLSDRYGFEQLRDHGVHPIPASKLFLSFDTPWRPGVALECAAVSASYTDLPMQQCYWFGAASTDEPTILMASLADDVSLPFWSALAKAPARNCADGEGSELRASRAMVASVRRQLALLYAGETVPAPRGALFVNWRGDPFGAGWHAWSTHTPSWRARRQIRSPAPGLYVCGEAYAERHGWVEGAINSAEMVVERLGVDRPSWVDGAYVFEQEEGETHMTAQVSELLIALGESAALRRVYERSPGEIMNAFGLDADAQDAVRSNDLARVKSAAGLHEAAFIVVKPAN
jgi:monoamine oxidase